MLMIISMNVSELTNRTSETKLLVLLLFFLLVLHLFRTQVRHSRHEFDIDSWGIIFLHPVWYLGCERDPIGVSVA